MAPEQIVDLKQFTLHELASELDRLWPLLKTDSIFRQKLAELNVSEDQLPARWRDAMELEPRGQGLEPITTAVIVKFVIPVVAKVAIDVWTHVLLPQIRADRGSDRLKPRE